MSSPTAEALQAGTLVPYEMVRCVLASAEIVLSRSQQQQQPRTFSTVSTSDPVNDWLQSRKICVIVLRRYYANGTHQNVEKAR